jgi:hypothetical protein
MLYLSTTTTVLPPSEPIQSINTGNAAPSSKPTLKKSQNIKIRKENFQVSQLSLKEAKNMTMSINKDYYMRCTLRI